MSQRKWKTLKKVFTILGLSFPPNTGGNEQIEKLDKGKASFRRLKDEFY
jgi:hypothetical protein